MPKRPSPHPTDAELEILTILWLRGSSTVRQVHDVVLESRQTSLTTTLKTLQVMTQKGLVICSDDRPHRYIAAAPAATTRAGMLQDLLHKAFDGSVQTLLTQLVNAQGLSPEELDDMARLIRDTRKRGGK